MKKLLILSFLFFAFNLQAQQLPGYLKGKVQYPVLDQNPFVGVIDTDVEGMGYDKKIDYKVVIDVYDEVKDSAAMYNVPAILEIARTYNLIAANGAPKEKIHMAVVVHGMAVYGILSNEAYNRQYGMDNPNIEIIKALINEGVEFYVCGQNLGFFQVPRTDIMPEVKVALSAKTTFITLDQRGYSYLNVNQD